MNIKYHFRSSLKREIFFPPKTSAKNGGNVNKQINRNGCEVSGHLGKRREYPSWRFSLQRFIIHLSREVCLYDFIFGIVDIICITIYLFSFILFVLFQSVVHLRLYSYFLFFSIKKTSHHALNKRIKDKRLFSQKSYIKSYILYINKIAFEQ